MKRIIRLTESDLTRIVKRVINEDPDKTWDEVVKYLKKGGKVYDHTGSNDRGFTFKEGIEGITSQGVILSFTKNIKYTMWLNPDNTYNIWTKGEGKPGLGVSSDGAGYESGKWKWDNSEKKLKITKLKP
jgi:hypothetical protein